MNKARRKELEDCQTKLNAIANEAIAIAARLEEIRDEEQDAYDNMPESLQNTERGEEMLTVIDGIKNILSNLESLQEADSEMQNLPI